MTFRIEHALVMDTDHLPGGGGYSVAAVSQGVEEPERVFVADNFGISDFLHDPTNERIYYSILPVPGGRIAFVRRFAHGTRRNGVQSRLFVHTLFIDDDLLPRLMYLPWLLLDRPLRFGHAQIFLDSNPKPLLAETFPAIEWDGNLSTKEAFDVLAEKRYQPLLKRFRQDEELAAFDPSRVVAASLDAIARGERVVLPQGFVYEQLSMVIWSMMPPADRMQLAWTQHESANTAVTFSIANVPAPDEAIDFSRVPSRSSLQLVAASTASADEWSEMQTAMAEYGISLRTQDVAPWLGWQDARQTLLNESGADRDVLIAHLQKLANSVRLDRRDRWVNEIEVLDFLLALIARGRKSGESNEQAAHRFSELFETSGIAAVVFRVPPPAQLLDKYEESLGTGALVECFVRGSERIQRTAPTRAAIAKWLLTPGRVETVAVPILGRLVERLAVDGSEFVKPLLQQIVTRPNGLSQLATVLPPHKEGIGDAVLTAVLLGIQSGSPETPAFISHLLFPQLDLTPALRGRISDGQADSIGGVLRTSPDDFAAFASRMPAEIATSLVSSAESWLMTDRSAALPLARAILTAANRAELPGVDVDELALRAAELRESPALWLPAALDFAGRLDDRGDSAASQQFVRRLENVPTPAKDNAVALRQFVSALRQRAAQRSGAGVATRSLVRFTRPWTDSGSLSDALQAAIANEAARAPEWSDVVADLVAASGTSASLLTTYWERTGASEFGAVPPALIEALSLLGAAPRERVVSRWLPRLRMLPDRGSALRFFDVLAAIAPDEQRSRIAIERSWHEIEHDRADAVTLARIDGALRSDGQAVERVLRDAIGRVMARRRVTTERAAWLVRVSADLDTTAPSTRRIIESHFLPKELSRIETHHWTEFLSEAGDDIFAHGYILLTIAYYLKISNASEDAVRRFQQRCRNRERSDALAVLAGASRNLMETVAVWGSKGMDRLRGEGRL